MKSVKFYIIGLYVYLITCLSLVVVPFLYNKLDYDFNANLSYAMIELILGEIVVLAVWGWLLVAGAYDCKKKGMEALIGQGWRLLKLSTVPFYVLNFIYSVLAWGVLVGASRGLAVLLVPVPVVITCTFIVQSGCVGWFYINYLKKENGMQISFVHYILQCISVLDIISTIMILKKEKKIDANAN